MGKDSVLDSNSLCSASRSAYYQCFNRWYTEKFLKGQWDKEECVGQWEAYRSCIMKQMEDRNLSHLFKVESLMYSRPDDPGCPLSAKAASK